jgi:hypothetical protein
VERNSLQEPAVIYPNPSREGIVKIDLSGLPKREVDIEIVDIPGRSYYHAKSMGGEDREIHLKNARQGVYYARITDNGTTHELMFILSR